MDPKIIAAIISAIVSFLVAFGVMLFNRSFQRKQNTFELMKVFMSTEMLTSRTQTLALLKIYLPNTEIGISIHDLKNKIKEEQWMQFSQLTHFFAEIRNLNESKVTDKDLSKKLFIRYFKAYDEYYSKIIKAEEQISTKLQSRLIGRIKELKTHWKI